MKNWILTLVVLVATDWAHAEDHSIVASEIEELSAVLTSTTKGSIDSASHKIDRAYALLGVVDALLFDITLIPSIEIER